MPMNSSQRAQAAQQQAPVYGQPPVVYAAPPEKKSGVFWIVVIGLILFVILGLGGAGAGLGLEDGGSSTGGGFASPSYEVNPVITNHNYNYNNTYAEAASVSDQQSAPVQADRVEYSRSNVQSNVPSTWNTVHEEAAQYSTPREGGGVGASWGASVDWGSQQK